MDERERFGWDMEQLPSGIWVHRRGVHQDTMNWDEVYFGDVYRFRGMPLFREDEVIVDIGASLGPFTKLAYERNPKAKIIAVEACHENIPVLQANVGQTAHVVHAACTYEKDVLLANTCFEGGVNSGGSLVATRSAFPEVIDPAYRIDDRPLPTITLEEIIERYSLDMIDVLKLDCEGSEMSILENTTSLDRVRQIIGEWHGLARFEDICTRIMRQAGFHLTVLSGGDIGIFWLSRWENLDRIGVAI